MLGQVCMVSGQVYIVRFIRYGLLGQFSGSVLLDEICCAGVYLVWCFGRGDLLGGVSHGLLVGIYSVGWIGVVCWIQFPCWALLGRLRWAKFAGSG